MAIIGKQPRAVRQFLADAERAERRAAGVMPSLAAQLREQAQQLREAAARIAERHRQKTGEDLFS